MPEVIEQPTESERILFVGETGSGKTQLARRMLDTISSYVVIDQKHDFPLRENDQIAYRVNDKRLWVPSDDSRIILRPIPTHSTGRALDWLLGKLFQRAIKRGKPFVVYIDEMYAFARSRSVVNLSACIVAGRSKKMGVWGATQRPVYIPVEMRDQANRIYIFNIANRKDRKELLNYLPDEYTLDDIQTQTQMYSFIEVKRDPKQQSVRTVRHMPPIRI